jgi:hypothetical protein
MRLATLLLLLHLRRKDLEELTSFQLSLSRTLFEIIRERDYYFDPKPTNNPLK